MELEWQIRNADYIIDALLGTGTSRPLVDDMHLLLQRVEKNASNETQCILSRLTCLRV